MTSERSATSRSGFDVVLGNPPFLNQLELATTASRGPAAMLHVLSDGAVSGYVDLSATFLLKATRMCREGGRVALVQPQSLLAAKDAGLVRSAVLDSASLTQLWISNELVFDGVNVLTCAPTLHCCGPRVGRLSRSSTGTFKSIPAIKINNDDLRSEETWSHLAAAALEIPEFEHVEAGCVGDIATATADFRDQYYGLDGFLTEDADIDRVALDADVRFPPIVTTGLIDLAECMWGRHQTKILKKAWAAPRIDRGRMRTDGKLSAWISSRLVPKVLLATQTKVLEAFVDVDGRYVPSLPLITIKPNSKDDIWRLAAAIASPVCVGIAMQKYSGTALAAQAIKLSAKQTAALPLPEDGPDWDIAAATLKAAHFVKESSAKADHFIAFANAIVSSYRVPTEQAKTLVAWWVERLGLVRESGKIINSE